jgi:hypothetical protein
MNKLIEENKFLDITNAESYILSCIINTKANNNIEIEAVSVYRRKLKK